MTLHLPALSAAVDRCSHPINSMQEQRMSSGNISPREARLEKTAYRRDFKAKWQQFMQEEFGHPAEIAHHFGCDPDTAENWLNGFNAPQGHFVGYAFNRWPQKAAAYLAGFFG